MEAICPRMWGNRGGEGMCMVCCRGRLTSLRVGCPCSAGDMWTLHDGQHHDVGNCMFYSVHTVIFEVRLR